LLEGLNKGTAKLVIGRTSKRVAEQALVDKDAGIKTETAKIDRRNIASDRNLEF
jgi:hypothetical protein